MNLPNAPSWSTYPAQAAFISWTTAAGTKERLAFDLVEGETWNENAAVTEHPVEVGANVGDHVRVELRQCELKVFTSNEPLGGISPNGPDGTVTVPLDVPVATWQGGSNTLLVPQWNNLIALRAFATDLVGLAGGARGRGGDIAELVAIEAADLLLQPFKSEIPVITDAGLVNVTPPGKPTATVEMQTTPTDFVAQLHQLLRGLKDQAQVFSVFGTKDTCLSMVIEKLTFTRDVDSGTGESLTIGFKELRYVSTQVVTAPIPNLPAGGGQPSVNHGGQSAQDAPPTVQGSVLLYATKNG